MPILKERIVECKATAKLTYSCLITLRQTALWAVEFWEAQHYAYNTDGSMQEALRYYKILNYIEDRMRKYSLQS